MIKAVDRVFKLHGLQLFHEVRLHGWACTPQL